VIVLLFQAAGRRAATNGAVVVVVWCKKMFSKAGMQRSTCGPDFQIPRMSNARSINGRRSTPNDVMVKMMIQESKKASADSSRRRCSGENEVDEGAVIKGATTARAAQSKAAS